MSFAIHKQVHPPTGVDHAVAAYFTHPIGDGGPPNLVVMQANHLTVFAIRRDPSADPSGDAALSAKAVALAKKKRKTDNAGADDEGNIAAAERRAAQLAAPVVKALQLEGSPHLGKDICNSDFPTNPSCNYPKYPDFALPPGPAPAALVSSQTSGSEKKVAWA